MAKNTQLQCDVLIVGGGPAGLSVAGALPADVSVILVHQDKEIGKPVRTSGGSWLSDMKRMGVPSHLYQKMTSIDIYSDNEHASFVMKRQSPVVLDVTGLYKWIARKAEKKHTNILVGTKFMGTRKNDAGFYVSNIRSKTEGVSKIVSNYIIDASGIQCSVLQSLSLAEKPKRHGIGVEYEYLIGKNDPHRAILFVGKDALSGYGWVFPTSDKKIRIGVGIIHPDTNSSPKELLEGFINSPSIKRFNIDVSGSPSKIVAGTIPSIPYESRLVFDNIIRVGDSANFATPTVGEGIRICMELGEFLGKQLGETMRSGSSQHLIQYEKECRKALSRNYKLGFQANKKISSYTPEDWDSSIRRLARLNEEEVSALLRSEFSIKMIIRAVWKSIQRKFSKASSL